MAGLSRRQTSAGTPAWLEWTLVGLGIAALLVAPFLVYPCLLYTSDAADE